MSGDTRKASAAYFAAVNAAQRQPGLHPSFHKEIERAKAECAAAAAQYEAHIRDKAANAGLMDGSGRARSEQAIDLMFGRKQVYYQQPEKFLFPELPQIQFYNPDDFSWKDDLIAATSTIQSELEAVLSSPIDFEPYVPADTDSQQLRANRLCGNTDWGAFHLRKDGVRVEANASKCPQTLEALKQTPQPVVKGKSPIALFSRLTPGAHIPPHTGLMNTRLICHLPLVTPDGCSLRVGNQERQWRQGEMLIFDDSIEHEAQNTGSSDRIILLFDIWRPELSEEERSFIAMIFEAIEDYGVLI
ncbi:MAG: aspartyl/asparaginyl beta-hydroxylase domain-containing protein [Hyphococcus sp.]